MGDGWSKEDYPDDWNRRRKRVYSRDGYQCQDCGIKGGPTGDAELHCHHIKPKSHGGSHDEENLRTLCHSCHNQKHSHHIRKMSEVGSSQNTISTPRSRSESNGPAAPHLLQLGKEYGESSSTPSDNHPSRVEVGQRANTTESDFSATNHSKKPSRGRGHLRGRLAVLAEGVILTVLLFVLYHIILGATQPLSDTILVGIVFGVIFGLLAIRYS